MGEAGEGGTPPQVVTTKPLNEHPIGVVRPLTNADRAPATPITETAPTAKSPATPAVTSESSPAPSTAAPREAPKPAETVKPAEPPTSTGSQSAEQYVPASYNLKDRDGKVYRVVISGPPTKQKVIEAYRSFGRDEEAGMITDVVTEEGGKLTIKTKEQQGRLMNIELAPAASPEEAAARAAAHEVEVAQEQVTQEVEADLQAKIIIEGIPDNDGTPLDKETFDKARDILISLAKQGAAIGMEGYATDIYEEYQNKGTISPGRASFREVLQQRRRELYSKFSPEMIGKKTQELIADGQPAEVLAFGYDLLRHMNRHNVERLGRQLEARKGEYQRENGRKYNDKDAQEVQRNRLKEMELEILGMQQKIEDENTAYENLNKERRDRLKEKGVDELQDQVKQLAFTLAATEEDVRAANADALAFIRQTFGNAALKETGGHSREKLMQVLAARFNMEESEFEKLIKPMMEKLPQLPTNWLNGVLLIYAFSQQVASMVAQMNKQNQ
jgi:hypothetical protein